MPSNTHEITNVCVFAGSSPGNRKIYSETAIELAEKLTENNYGIVFGGGSNGLMGVLADNAIEANGYIIGIITEQLDIAGLFGIYPPGFVAQVVAFAFGLAAATLFPALLLGIFTKSINKEGAVSGMLTGLIFTLGYIVYFKFLNPEMNTSSNWLMGISPEGIGTIGMLINVFVSIMVSKFTSKPPSEIDDLISNNEFQ